MNKIDKVKQGRSNKRKGGEFERKVRADLEANGFIVCKWSNNVDLLLGKIIPNKHKFNPFKNVMTMGTGFPDFVAFKKSPCDICSCPGSWLVLGVEAKSAGYLDKIEKEKVKWLLDNNVFDFILTAYKGDKRGEILYEQTLKGGHEQQWK